MRLSLRRPKEDTWEVEQYVWLENIGDEHLMLNLKSGKLRLDKGRRYRFRTDILDDPQIHELLDARKLAIVED